MIKATFRYGGEVIEIIIDRNNVLFYDTSSQMTTSIEGLKLSKAGVIKEFPDLKDETNWKEKATKRFKDHIKSFKSEIEKIYYIKEELKKHGYEPMTYQRGGHRPRKFKDEQ